MKVDILASNFNCSKSIETKTVENKGDFLKFFEDCIENMNLEDTTENNMEIDENLNALIELILKYLAQNNTNFKGEDFCAADFTEIKESIDACESKTLEKLVSLYDRDEVLATLDKSSFKDLEKVKEILDEVFSKTNKSEIHKDLTIVSKERTLGNSKDSQNKNMNFVKEGQRNYEDYVLNRFKEKINFINYKETPVLESEEYISKQPLKISDKDVFKEREIHEYSNELGILKEIAFSNSTGDREIKTLKPLVIRQQYMGEDIFKAAKYIVKNSLKELDVKLSPKDLGDMNIKFLKSEEENKFIITLSKKDVLGLLKENINEIKSYLMTLNENVKNVSVEIRSESQRGFSQDFNRQFHEDNSKRQGNKGKSNMNLKDKEKSSILEEEINLLI